MSESIKGAMVVSPTIPLSQLSSSRRTAAVAITGLALAVLPGSRGDLDAQSAKSDPQPVVRIVYLVPADRAVNEDYVELLEAAIEHVQIWFRNELGDATFSLLRQSPFISQVNGRKSLPDCSVLNRKVSR